ncbi:glycosyltransferase [Acinetobacter tianfuensis]|uniref:glycosyltransferase n=1 Tax=Acinetobacter tianfuensis TaxID=2419603 RepID=UPI001D188F98|nr:glycosyltransferase [Acinetobacter tianfuensis]
MLISRCEGFLLAVLESLCHGVPAVSYDIPYGPSSMIQHNVNGILTEHRNYQLMAQEISKKLNELKKMSDAAYQSIDSYREENVAKIWSAVIQA